MAFICRKKWNEIKKNKNKKQIGEEDKKENCVLWILVECKFCNLNEVK